MSLMSLPSKGRTMKTSRAPKTGILALSILLLLFFSIVAKAVEKTGEKQEAETGLAATADPFIYQLENRSDPFVPFLTERAASTSTLDPNEILDVNEPLTGMQLFEPGQLTLVALLNDGEGDIAMVQDFTGKGYLLREGIKIGRRGVIRDITDNNVIIEETATTRSGQKIVSEVVMILKKEGEK